MHYWDMPDHARALSERALELIRECKSAPTPPHYELWFNYASGLNQELIEALNDAVQQGHASDPAFMRDLHMRFFGGNLTTAIDDMGEKLQQELHKFVQVLEDAGQDTASYGKTLNVAAQQLSSGDVNQFKAVVQSLVAATRAIETKHKAIETELKSSSNEIKSLRQRLESIREESRVDALTGLVNRRGFDEQIASAVREADADRSDLCLLIGDVDFFKRFNDTWGHATGDQVLRLVAQCFKANTKGRDMAARYGGEEFVVLLPDTPVDGAFQLAENIRGIVARCRIKRANDHAPVGNIRVSLGVASFKPGESAAGFVARADAALYMSKKEGRNRVTLAPV